MSFYFSNDEMLKELYKGEEEIKKMINKPNNVQNGFKQYGLINSKWLENYLNYLKNTNSNPKEKFSFDYKHIFGKTENKDYTYIDDNMDFCFLTNFSFVSKKALYLIAEQNNNEIERKKFENCLDYIIIGGGCIIKRDFSGVAPYSHIIIYKENKNNNIDYIIKIDDKIKREEARNYILKNNIWNYIKKIEYTEEDDYKEIYDNEKNIIGYIVRNGSSERIQELKNLEKEMLKKETLIYNTNIQNIPYYFNKLSLESSPNNKNISMFNDNININNINNNMINRNIIDFNSNINNMNIINIDNNMNNSNCNISNFNNNQNNNCYINTNNANYQNNNFFPNNNFINNPFDQNNIFNYNQFNNLFGNNNDINQINNFNNNLMFNNQKDQEKDNKISELLKSNNELNNRIIQLENELNQEKEKNKISNNKINNLQNELDKSIKKYKEEVNNNEILKEKVNSYKNNVNSNLLMTKFMELMEDLKIKDKKLNEITSQLKFDLAEGEKLMTVIFTSTKYNCMQSFICKNTDQFTRIESLLYEIEEYKQYKLIDNYFLVGGRKINRYQTLEENGIKNSDLITLVKMVED